MKIVKKLETLRQKLKDKKMIKNNVFLDAKHQHHEQVHIIENFDITESATNFPQSLRGVKGIRMIGSMTVDELKEKLDAKTEIVLIDCREQNEWDEAHIEAAQFLPLSNFEEEMKKLNDKSATIICQCRSGKRSLKAAMMLQGEGFDNLFNLEGGILAWLEKGYPTA